MGKGGGGGGSQPQVSTAYQTNLPEYAEPYVKNMLQAAEAQVYAPGKTGFREYQPYSTDPTQYFAGPSSLQQSTYGEAAGMRTPGQFAPATGIAGMAGLGQLGAGGAYQQMATDPRAVQSYMSPFAQNVIDIQKQAAMREAQIGNVGNKLAAARQGTYGGARETLGRLEREKNLQSRLGEIQATGSQQAYDRAMQNMQFGSNLGLQGLAGASQTAGTLGQLGGQQQQADLSRMGFQNQLGQQQQQYQQNIINQAIQDYATQQQYPFMQLSTMSNLLRGLPMQGMTTQQYQAQPSTLQQGLGLLGTGASLYGAMGRKEGGTIKEYARGGIAEDLRAKLEDMADTDPKGLAKLVSQSSSKEVKKIGNEILSGGIATANTGGLATNLAGGGIIAFADGGDIPGFYEGDLIDQNYDYNQSGYGTLFGSTRAGLAKEREEEERKRKEAFLAENAPEALAAMRKREAEPKGGFTESSFKDFDQAQALLEKERYGAKPSAGAPAADTTTTGTGTQSTGLDAILADRKRRLGIDGPGEKSEAFMKALEERQAGLGKQSESDRYLRMAEAFAKFGSTAGPIGRTASEALGGFAKGEALARRDQDKMQLEGMKMQADLEKARRAEERGDLDAAEKFYNSAKDRENRIEVANASANRQVELIERAMKDPEFMDALRSTKGLDSKTQQTALTNYVKWESGAGLSDPKFRELAKAVKEKKEGAVQALEDYKEQKYNDFLAKAGGKSSSTTSSGSGKVDASNPLLK
jgi:hypothetical protein